MRKGEQRNAKASHVSSKIHVGRRVGDQHSGRAKTLSSIHGKFISLLLAHV